jgi:hypothetical protein
MTAHHRRLAHVVGLGAARGDDSSEPVDGESGTLTADSAQPMSTS